MIGFDTHPNLSDHNGDFAELIRNRQDLTIEHGESYHVHENMLGKLSK